MPAWAEFNKVAKFWAKNSYCNFLMNYLKCDINCMTKQSKTGSHRRAGHNTILHLHNLDGNTGIIPSSHEHLSAIEKSESTTWMRSLDRSEKHTNHRSLSAVQTPLHKMWSSNSASSPEVRLIQWGIPERGRRIPVHDLHLNDCQVVAVVIPLLPSYCFQIYLHEQV
jgi:hypothetical protein